MTDPDADAPMVGRETLTLPAEPASAGLARALIRRVLTAAGRGEHLDAAELACTELVTNAILHAHTDIEITVEVRGDVRVEVRDSSLLLPAQLNYDVEATTGRGLALVAALSDEHGITDAGPDGKTVWFRLGGDQPRPQEDILSAWDDGDWFVDEPSVPVVADQVRTVRLLGLPSNLWLAARQHHDALLREFVLYAAVHEVEDVDVHADVVSTDLARSIVSTAVIAALPEEEHAPGRHGDAGDGQSWTTLPVDLDLEVPPYLGRAFTAKKDTLDVAERLARGGHLLTRPGLAEIVAVRNWECDQVVTQLAGARPVPWSDARESYMPPEDTDGLWFPVEDFDVAVVHTTSRALVAADDANRIVAVSRRFTEATGWEPEDVVGRRVASLIPVRFRESHVAAFSRHLSARDGNAPDVPHTVPVLCPGGREILCRYLIERAPDGSGRPVYLAWIEPLEPSPV
ncbi:ATP-binding protein [Actinotalea sp. K2]|uniref:ATP-binding protein n=1 Tax=Actinotalea sp. K2 TaxID=2939438 RepID=UPI0020175372|nr:ATP-binding protein [Actinotalea sp. K2]MCL3860918.1 PAS domain S-box protein [Actinotalea sp. K2]